MSAVIKAVQGQHRIDPNRVFTLSWSSSGPAAYAISLQEQSPVVGSYIAMSVIVALQIYGPGAVWFDTLSIRQK